MLGRDCDYGDELENYIRDEVIYKCSSETIRCKYLEAWSTFTLTKLLEIAGEEEHRESHMLQMHFGATVVTPVANCVTLKKIVENDEE